MTRQSEKVKELERIHPHSGTTVIILDGRPYAFTTASHHEEQCLQAIFASDCTIHQGKGLTKTATIWNWEGVDFASFVPSGNESFLDVVKDVISKKTKLARGVHVKRNEETITIPDRNHASVAEASKIGDGGCTICCINSIKANPFSNWLKVTAPKGYKILDRNDVLTYHSTCAGGHFDTYGSIRVHGLLEGCVGVVKLFIIYKDRSIKNMKFLQQWAGGEESGYTLSELMTQYAFEHRDLFHWVVMRNGEWYEHEGSVFHAVYTGVDTSVNPSGIGVSVGFRRTDEEGKKRWLQYATRGQSTPVAKDGTLSAVDKAREAGWRKKMNPKKKGAQRKKPGKKKVPPRFLIQENLESSKRKKLV